MAKDAGTKRQTTYERGPDFQTIYSNNAVVDRSAWDVRIRLGQIQSATKERLVIKEQACVYMSPEHAKAFLGILRTTISDWEEEHGTIATVPPATVKESKD